MGGCFSTPSGVSRHGNNYYSEPQTGKSSPTSSSTSPSANTTHSHGFPTRASSSATNTAPRHDFGEIQKSSQLLRQKKKSHGTNRTGLPGPSTSNLTQQQQALVGVARWPDPRYNSENSAAQHSYGQSFWNGTRKAGSRISGGKISSLNELWNHASDWRSKAAGSSSTTFRANSREPTDEKFHSTPLINEYSYIKDRYAERRDGEINRLRFGLPPQMLFQIHDEINGESISLTSIAMSTDLNADRTDEIRERFRSHGLDELGEPFYIDHTAAANVPRIMAHAESLYNHALDPEIDNSQALSTLGELHWWLAHAMPDHRGSAAKSEFCVRSIAQARGMDLPPFQQGIVPDLEAMTTTRSDFVREYSHMLAWN